MRLAINETRPAAYAAAWQGEHNSTLQAKRAVVHATVSPNIPVRRLHKAISYFL